jgi:hypothetical protein
MPGTPSDLVIGPVTYRVRPLGGRASRQVQLRIARVFAAAVSTGRGFNLGRIKGSLKGWLADPDAAMKAFSDADMDLVCDHFAGCTTVLAEDVGTMNDGRQIRHNPKGRPLAPMFDEQMGGANQAHFIPWLVHCFKTNFPDDFFSVALGDAGPEKDGSPSGSPQGTTGSSGDSTATSD